MPSPKKKIPAAKARSGNKKRKAEAGSKYDLTLFVSGSTERSMTAVRNIKRICEENLTGRYSLKVVDIYQQPKLAMDEQIVAVPTLLKKLPGPLRRVIGDLSDDVRVLVSLDHDKDGLVA